ncbi:MAG: RtcB family protein [Candidatus Helarchaeota archaeon]|nr:RtcB family protein [Candidatus Helarchaeota archaeon]
MSRIDRSNIPIKKLEEYVYEISPTFKQGMKVPARVYCNEQLLEAMKRDRTLQQASNITFLPGITKFSAILPDAHQGYGFPIGGVAAIDVEKGVVSPGGVGYDINCGVRLVRTNLFQKDIKQLKELINSLFRNVPSGLGSKGKIRLSRNELDQAAETGMEWAVENGYGWPEDLNHAEEGGKLAGADAHTISNRAKERGIPQLGSLGSGNHFLEIQKVDKIYDEAIAKKMKIYEPGQILVMIHSGSRGFGHQICTDYLREMERAMHKYKIKLPDRELACAPVSSAEGQRYLKAMACAANFAWANRQMIMHWVRSSFAKLFNTSAEDLDLNLIYDVAHNIAKIEEHKINGEKKTFCVHRKGATRAFPPFHPALNTAYKEIGQPVLLPGSMGTASYLLLGGKRSLELSFGSTAHGAGRVLSRSAAKRRFWGETIKKELQSRGTYVKAASMKIISEEAPKAYKDIDLVAKVSDKLEIAKKLVRMVPIGVTKG